MDHRADTFGTVAGRASLVGSSVAYVPVQATPFPPFLTQLGATPGHSAPSPMRPRFTPNPAENLEATSHELRLSRSTENMTMRIGAYYSKSDD